MTSTWIQSAPAPSTARPPRRAGEVGSQDGTGRSGGGEPSVPRRCTDRLTRGRAGAHAGNRGPAGTAAQRGARVVFGWSLTGECVFSRGLARSRGGTPLLITSRGRSSVWSRFMHSHVGAARRGSALDMIASLQALTSGLNSPQGAATTPRPSMSPPKRRLAVHGRRGMWRSLDDARHHECAVRGAKPDIRSSGPSASPRNCSRCSTPTARVDQQIGIRSTLGQNGNASAADGLFAKLDPNGDGAVDPKSSRAPCSERRERSPSPPSYGGG